ncbi:MAG: c-type cytochrome [Verrucomicrobiota bacterium JB023]|nr:c-type cytochrome [Verrucomicrobiota bacterium JB023]
MRRLLPLCLTACLQAEPVSQQITPAEQEVSLPAGFTLDQVFEVPKELGSWVSLANYKEGKILAGDQYGGIYTISIDGETTTVEPLDIEIGGAHGLLWHDETLYISVNENVTADRGIYMAKDKDQNGSFESIEKLTALGSPGEHGTHALVPSPDGEWIYVVAGNYSKLPELDHSHVPELWEEDQLLPRNPDGLGHASSIRAPGGFVLRFRPGGTQWELISSGYRNPYDGAFNEDGEFFVYDADMEWDMGTPWYRPTRVCWSVPGAEYGWRHGSGKWPAYYEDSLPGVTAFGPGSPTGVLSGKGLEFPAKYQKAIFCFDWTFATIYAVNLSPSGTGYSGEWEEFFSAAGFPLTDAVSKDGDLYFATGGRRGASSLWRVRYTGDADTSDAWEPKDKHPAKEGDRWDRYLRRTAAEHKGPEAAREFLTSSAPLEKLNGVIALARLNSEKDRANCIETLKSFDWNALNKEEQLCWLRAAGLVFIRLGEPSEDERKLFIDMLDSSFPNEDADLDAELCRILCYFQAPGIVSRTLAKMAQEDEGNDLGDWVRLVERNGRYGKDVAAVLRESGSPRDMHYAYCLRVVEGPWKESERRQLMEWYSQMINGKGARSAGRALVKMRNDTLETATSEERKMIATWGLVTETSPFRDLPKAEGPGKNYTIEEIVEIADNITEYDRENGQKMFKAALCASCHRYGSEGGAAGPDLTNVAGRFNAYDLATAIVEPNKAISDQYEFKIFTKTDGAVTVGKVMAEKDEILVIAVNPFDFSKTVEISRAELKSIEPSPLSPMPGALVNQLNEEELRDLMGFLLKK